MKILLTGDLHYGFSKKTTKILQEFFCHLSTLDFDVMVIAGDIISCRQREMSKCFELIRYYIPDVPILAVMGNHDCLDDKTEAYTKEGWKKYQDISLSDEVMGLNLETNEVEFQPINKIIIKDHNGQMKVMNNANVDLMCTPKHRILHQKRYEWKTKFELAENLKTNRIYFPISGNIKEFKKWYVHDRHFEQQRCSYRLPGH